MGRGETAGQSVGVAPNQPKTPNRVVRVPDDLWKAAQGVARERGEFLSDVIRDALRDYVKRYGR